MSASIESMQNRGPVVLAVTIALLAVSTTAIFLRLVSRIGVVRRVLWDDYFIIVAWLLAFGFSFSICWGTHRGLGRHEVDVKPEWEAGLKRAEYGFSVLYNPVLMATKTSILIFYLTLSKSHKVFRGLTIATIVVVNAAGLALTFVNIFPCRPITAHFQDPLPAHATCINIVTLYLSSAPVNIITDLAILFLPMPILTSLRLPRKQKIILIITFSFGAFVAVIDVVRIAYLESASLVRLQEQQQGSYGPVSRMSQTGDFSWYASLSFMWSAIEVHVGIMCACVPALKPLVSKVLPSMLRDVNEAYNSFDRTHVSSSVSEGPRSDELVEKDLGVPSGNTTTDAAPGSDPNNMNMLESITTPDTAGPATSTQTAATVRTGSTAFFDFVDINRPKSILRMSNKESFFPVALVTILFFLWGFAYGLLSVLNDQFVLIVKLNASQSAGLHSAYYAGYFVAPLAFGGFVLKKWGFKACFVLGLCIYSCGTLVFWPSAVLTSFPAFLISNFIVGLGLATLEIASNLFVAVCGPPQHAETRLNASQGVQAIGSVLSPLLARKVFFRNISDAPSLVNVQWAYLGIAIFDVLLAIAFYYAHIPEASDEDLAILAERREITNSKQVLRHPVIYVTLALGIFSQFCYVGGQEAVVYNFQTYVTVVQPHPAIVPFDYLTVGRTAFVVGRFISAFACYFITPSWVLMFLYLGMIVSSALAMSVSGNAGIAMITLIMLFESGTFPLIYAIAIRGLGKHTKMGSALLTAATSGGIIGPVIMSPVSNSRGLQYAFCVVVAIFAFGLVFPPYLLVVPAARAQVDPIHRLQRRRWSLDRVPNIFGSTTRKRINSDLPTIGHVEGEWDVRSS
ncbi:Major facilitator superfamily domain, general substrate transporter [Lasallia pustulata]|uniref:Major facilitator superfamily domain, general substrate transporter n=1 Tax=Lasallia pustulata TaxID=136370 RepID=A0A1W5CXQ4_9LECA|nr:Major facilitator superfamily domain, general substrate transporter [Lasallia pustulata]